MSDYFDCIAFRKTRNDKTKAVRLGAAKKRDDGGFNVYLDALPVPENGSYGFSIVPQRERTTGGKAHSYDAPRDLDDEIPF